MPGGDLGGDILVLMVGLSHLSSSSFSLLFLPPVLASVTSKLRDWAKLLASDCFLPRLKSLVGRAAPRFRIKFVS